MPKTDTRPTAEAALITRRDWTPDGGHPEDLPLFTATFPDCSLSIDIHARDESDARSRIEDVLLEMYP